MLLLDPDAHPIVGHRGASGEYPENTLLAFRHALEQGADALELDVRLTADGVVVVMHDATLDRTTTGRGPVHAHTLEALQRVDAGRGEGVPTLANVMESFPDTPLIVEIKEAAVASQAAREIARHGATGRVLVGSFVHAALGPFGCGFHRASSRRETAWCWAASRIGWAAGVRSIAAFTVPERHGRLRVVDAPFVRAARRRSRPVHVWTVDDPADARRLRGLGVAGIITNFPARMRGIQAQ